MMAAAQHAWAMEAVEGRLREHGTSTGGQVASSSAGCRRAAGVAVVGLPRCRSHLCVSRQVALLSAVLAELLVCKAKMHMLPQHHEELGTTAAHARPLHRSSRASGSVGWMGG